MQNVTYVDVNELLMTAARAAAVYVLMLLVIRALGRRTVGNVSAFDLLVALMLGEIVDETSSARCARRAFATCVKSSMRSSSTTDQ